MRKRERLIKCNERREIFWNIINSLLTGALVLLGSFTAGEITKKAIGTALIAAVLVAFLKFKDYWDGEKKEYSLNAFNIL